MAESIILMVVIYVVIQNFVAQPFVVQQDSMQSTLESGEYILVDRFTPRFGGYHRGDIVVLDPPAAEGAAGPFIKRIIALPGEWVVINDGRVYVDDRLLEEPYLYNDEPTNAPDDADQFQVMVPADAVFVMGDHRAVSLDSRRFGPVPISSIIGRTAVRYYPLSHFGPIGGADVLAR